MVHQNNELHGALNLDLVPGVQEGVGVLVHPLLHSCLLAKSACRNFSWSSTREWEHSVCMLYWELSRLGAPVLDHEHYHGHTSTHALRHKTKCNVAISNSAVVTWLAYTYTVSGPVNCLDNAHLTRQLHVPLQHTHTFRAFTILYNHFCLLRISCLIVTTQH